MNHAISPSQRMAKLLIILILIAVAAFLGLIGCPLWAAIPVFVAAGLAKGGV